MKITHTQTEFACERHAARTAKRSRDPATSLHERALTGSVLADLATTSPAPTSKSAPLSTASSRRRGHIPRRYDLVMPVPTSPPTSAPGLDIGVNLIPVPIAVAR